MKRVVFAVVSALLLTAGAVRAQQVQLPSVMGFDSNLQQRLVKVGENHYKLIGNVEIESKKDGLKISADEMEIFTDKDLLTAKGNITLTTATERISADSLEFNIRTKLGTFYHATGSSQIEDNPRRPKPKNEFGTQEASVLFYGEKIEKIGYRKYRLSNGGFTTCIQANPRWTLTSGTVIINVNHYATLQNALFKVKGVPVFYLPVIFYPINKEDRATGILLPAYGTSTIRGNTINTAFYWAINRSQDSTFYYDWFSKTGSGYGADYRRTGLDASSAYLRFYRLNEKPVTYDNGAGGLNSAPGRQSFQVNSTLVQAMPLNLKARARIDYFSSVDVQQTYNFNPLDASRSQRYIMGGITGNWGLFGAGVTTDRSEYFYNASSSAISGAAPRLSFSKKESPLFGSPIYFSAGVEDAGLVRQTVSTDADSNRTVTDYGVNRFDVSPRIRFPFTKWPFFTINASLGWRFTRWNQSYDTSTGAQVFVPINRKYFDMGARFSGPSFTRIFLTPNSGYAEKLKHTIEPWFSIGRTTFIDNLPYIVKTDTSDYTYGGTTQMQYGVDTRLYAKRKYDGVVSASAEQVLTVGVRQTYYSDARAATYDPNYQSNLYLGSAIPQKVSPIALNASATPTQTFRVAFQTEYNTYLNMFLSFGASGTYMMGNWATITGGWSKRNYNMGGYGLAALSHYFNSETKFHFFDNKIGGQVGFNWDVQGKQFLQTRYVGYYNAQCCGFMIEYQAYDFSGLYYGGWKPPVPKDHRFSFGFSLAGIGTFSNIFGALGGGTTQMPRF